MLEMTQLHPLFAAKVSGLDAPARSHLASWRASDFAAFRSRFQNTRFIRRR
jgi:hypothetical protein